MTDPDNAGSILNFSSNTGTKIPAIAAAMILKRIASPITNPSQVLPNQSKYICHFCLNVKAILLLKDTRYIYKKLNHPEKISMFSKRVRFFHSTIDIFNRNLKIRRRKNIHFQKSRKCLYLKFKKIANISPKMPFFFYKKRNFYMTLYW